MFFQPIFAEKYWDTINTLKDITNVEMTRTRIMGSSICLQHFRMKATRYIPRGEFSRSLIGRRLLPPLESQGIEDYILTCESKLGLS